MADLKSLLAPVSKVVVQLDLTQPPAAEAELNRQFPPAGAVVEALATAAREALAAGTICQRGEPGMKFSRVLKPEQDVAGCSIDAVYMNSSKGPWHTHLKGEVCLCLPDSPSAQFEGRSAAWMVLPVGSRHEPTVTGGAMLILYWWPEGAVAWG
jgi:hypothetical protein